MVTLTDLKFLYLTLEPVISTAPVAIILSDERFKLIKLPSELYGLFGGALFALLPPAFVPGVCVLLAAGFVVSATAAALLLLDEGVVFFDFFLPRFSTLSKALLVIWSTLLLVLFCPVCFTEFKTFLR